MNIKTEKDKKRDMCKSKYKQKHKERERQKKKTVASVAFFHFKCAHEKRKKEKNILCLHSIMAVQAVITPGIVWVPHNIQRLVVC